MTLVVFRSVTVMSHPQDDTPTHSEERTMATKVIPAQDGSRLRANCLNFWEVWAQAIALISPTMTAALIVPASARPASGRCHYAITCFRALRCS